MDKVNTKSDGSPVTIADTLIEKKLREILATEFPTHAIYSR